MGGLGPIIFLGLYGIFMTSSAIRENIELRKCRKEYEKLRNKDYVRPSVGCNCGNKRLQIKQVLPDRTPTLGEPLPNGVYGMESNQQGHQLLRTETHWGETFR